MPITLISRFYLFVVSTLFLCSLSSFSFAASVSVNAICGMGSSYHTLTGATEGNYNLNCVQEFAKSNLNLAPFGNAVSTVNFNYGEVHYLGTANSTWDAINGTGVNVKTFDTLTFYNPSLSVVSVDVTLLIEGDISITGNARGAASYSLEVLNDVTYPAVQGGIVQLAEGMPPLYPYQSSASEQILHLRLPVDSEITWNTAFNSILNANQAGSVTMDMLNTAKMIIQLNDPGTTFVSQSGATYGFAITPVPETSSKAMILSGLMLFALCAQLRRKQR